ncbi:zinc finger protein 771-like [Bolinopsis microptera]|uniref:zinc finger protein 771-like n=1 Tax=Bolinopsis microptera TaxID=2820187 RepID=UPI003079A541
MPDEEYYKITCETYPGGWEKFVEDMENGESSDEEIERIELPPDLYNELISDKSNVVTDDDEERFKFGRINKDQTDTCLDRALELYDNYHNMTHDEYNKKVKTVLKDRDRIIVLDDDGDNTRGSTNKSNIPQTKDCVRKPESDDNLPSCSGVHHDLEHGQQHHCTATGCLKLFKTQLELETHKCGTTREVSRKGKEKVHKCDTCGNMFGWRNSLTKHIRTVHDKVARLTCPYCQYRTDHQHHLTQHILTHTGDKQYRCTHCDYTTVQKNTLTTHIYRNHTNKTHNCQYHECGVKKSSEQELYDHISLEHALQQYRCDVCPMSFKKPDGLKKHKLTHGDDEFKFKCRYCGRRFLRADNLKRHTVIHTGERAHKCGVCGKQFTRNSNLTVHMRVHTGAKPYSCTHCGMKFNVSSAKNRHESSCKYK